MFHCNEQETRPRPFGLIAVLLGIALVACQTPRATSRTDTAAPPTRVPHPAVLSEPTTYYVVTEGESLAAIARCSGVSIEILARANGITNPDRIYAGERLRLPASHGCTHEVVDSAGPARARASALLAKANASLDAADFENALAYADECQAKLAAHRRDAKANALRAQCHVAAGTAAIGLDHHDRAVAEFRRALAIDPGLELASDDTSPRVLELMAEARANPER